MCFTNSVDVEESVELVEPHHWIEGFSAFHYKQDSSGIETPEDSDVDVVESVELVDPHLWMWLNFYIAISISFTCLNSPEEVEDLDHNLDANILIEDVVYHRSRCNGSLQPGSPPQSGNVIDDPQLVVVLLGYLVQ